MREFNASKMRSDTREFLDRIEHHNEHVPLKRWGRTVGFGVPVQDAEMIQKIKAEAKDSGKKSA